MKAQPVGSKKTVELYCRAMDEIHRDGDKWIVFRLPSNASIRQHVKGAEFGCCRTSERADYEASGAVFV